jgi:hydroxymethylbilane synthase
MRIIIGTRGSDLALIQSEIVRKKLLTADPSLIIELKVIKTEGDVNTSPIPLDTVGKGWFTKEIETELLNGTIHLAVHSLKDLPETLPAGLHIGAYPAREDARDVLVSRGNVSLKDLPHGVRVGTDSTRRRVQLLALCPDLIVTSMRGNVPTRVKKVDDGTYDAAILAAAGLKRLGLEQRIVHYFSVEEMTPAPGQGILAVETKEDFAFLEKLNDHPAQVAAQVERAFSRAVGGGCKEPVGAYAEIKGGDLTLHGMIAPEDGSKIMRDSIKGNVRDALSLAEKLAKGLLERLSNEG